MTCDFQLSIIAHFEHACHNIISRFIIIIIIIIIIKFIKKDKYKKNY